MRKITETKTESRRLTDSRVFWAALSVFLAVIIWVYYGSNYGTEMTRTFSGVEVTYVGRDAMRDSQSLIISHEETSTVTVTLTGSRRELSKLSSDSLKAVVNLSTVASAGYRAMSYTLSYPASVNTAGIQETNKLPQTVGLQISKLMSRVVDFKCRFDGTMADGYTLDFSDISFDPAYITLMGPEEELDKVGSAFVVLDRDNVSSSFTATANYNLVTADGETLEFDDITSDVETVTVTVPVNMTKEVTLDLNLVEGGGARSQNVITEIEPQTITVAGDAATLEGINTIYLATVDLSDYLSFPETEYSIVLPNGTDNVTGTTSATVNMEFSGLDWAYYTVSNLDYTNLEDGYTADVMDVTLVVTVRAPSEILSQIEANNIRAVADLSGVTTTSKVPAAVYVDGFADAGAVGDYTLYVRVAPKEAAG